jgi:hypothetical protein
MNLVAEVASITAGLFGVISTTTQIYRTMQRRKEEKLALRLLRQQLLEKVEEDARNGGKHFDPDSAKRRVERSVNLLKRYRLTMPIERGSEHVAVPTPGVLVAKLIRLSWLSSASKRHYLETVADTQRDHHDAVRRGDFAQARSIRRELRWLIVKMSLLLLWETLKTAVGVAKVIKFLASLAG